MDDKQGVNKSFFSECTKLWKLSKWLWMFWGKNGGVAFWPCAYLHVLKANIFYPSYVKFSDIYLASKYYTVTVLKLPLWLICVSIIGTLGVK